MQDNKLLKVNFDHLNPPFYYFLLLVLFLATLERKEKTVLVYQTMKIPFRDGTGNFLMKNSSSYSLYNI